MSYNTLREAKQKGKEAYTAGYDVRDNQYGCTTKEHVYWNEGWCEAEREYNQSRRIGV